MMSISQNERERAIYRSRKKFQTDYQSDMATSWDNGAKSTALSIAGKMLNLKMSMDDIMDITGLTREEVERLTLKDLKNI